MLEDRGVILRNSNEQYHIAVVALAFAATNIKMAIFGHFCPKLSKHDFQVFLLFLAFFSSFHRELSGNLPYTCH